MRALIYLVLFLTVVLVVGVLWLGVHPQTWGTTVTAALNSMTMTGGKKPAPGGNPFLKEKEEADAKARVRAHTAGSAVREVAEVETAAAPVIAPAIRYRFPEAQEIPNGTARGALVARFGQPEATVTGADLGQLRERFLYVDPPTRRRTLIILINGNVTSAETFAQ